MNVLTLKLVFKVVGQGSEKMAERKGLPWGRFCLSLFRCWSLWFWQGVRQSGHQGQHAFFLHQVNLIQPWNCSARDESIHRPFKRFNYARGAVKMGVDG